MTVFGSIVLVSDGVSEEGDAAREALIQTGANGTSLSVLVAHPAFPKFLQQHQAKYEETLREKAILAVAKAAQDLQLTESEVVVDVVASDTPATAVIQRVLRNDHDLLVKQAGATSGGKGYRAFDMDLLRKCPCPVWLSRQNSRPRNAMQAAVAIDPECETEEARDLAVHLLQTARSLADNYNGTLRIVSCWELEFERYFSGVLSGVELNAAVEKERSEGMAALWRLISASGIAGDNRIDHLRGAPSAQVPPYVEDKGVDILVMGTVARTGIAGWIMGNTAENIFHDLNCSLLALKPKGYVSPVKAY